MARYDAQHKQATRQRMLETAGRRFKSDGIDGAGIATLVADAGLTNGAFYGHFASKDDLVACVVQDQLALQIAAVESLPPGPESVAAFVGQYLSPAHRDDPANGCPSAALLDEIGRTSDAARDAYTEGTRGLIAAIARRLGGDGDADAHERAIALFTLLVGAVQTARAVTDRALSDHILATAYTYAMAIALPRADSARRTGQDPS